ncbi:unnamed protein product [Vitrella brassicaformis CCMP3155]|uniref:Uncharacterized protein n=1 Tax=Vitrella brassicaformis (strain CCMP3155) TaxID=1169540 RepID=A0A0G4GBF7_VITBC|nr:unnamed protein product [Vitrella brassicaformis CCMP3155]|eukprot:CEM26003.1 unnamed protein product [Vitrella brassicaformis CCMP3155]
MIPTKQPSLRERGFFGKAEVITGWEVEVHIYHLPDTLDAFLKIKGKMDIYYTPDTFDVFVKIEGEGPSSKALEELARHGSVHIYYMPIIQNSREDVSVEKREGSVMEADINKPNFAALFIRTTRGDVRRVTGEPNPKDDLSGYLDRLRSFKVTVFQVDASSTADLEAAAVRVSWSGEGAQVDGFSKMRELVSHQQLVSRFNDFRPVEAGCANLQLHLCVFLCLDEEELERRRNGGRLDVDRDMVFLVLEEPFKGPEDPPECRQRFCQSTPARRPTEEEHNRAEHYSVSGIQEGIKVHGGAPHTQLSVLSCVWAPTEDLLLSLAKKMRRRRGAVKALSLRTFYIPKYRREELPSLPSTWVPTWKHHERQSNTLRDKDDKIRDLGGS